MKGIVWTLGALALTLGAVVIGVGLAAAPVPAAAKATAHGLPVSGSIVSVSRASADYIPPLPHITVVSGPLIDVQYEGGSGGGSGGDIVEFTVATAGGAVTVTVLNPNPGITSALEEAIKRECEVECRVFSGTLNFLVGGRRSIRLKNCNG